MGKYGRPECGWTEEVTRVISVGNKNFLIERDGYCAFANCTEEAKNRAGCDVRRRFCVGGDISERDACKFAPAIAQQLTMKEIQNQQKACLEIKGRNN